MSISRLAKQPYRHTIAIIALHRFADILKTNQLKKGTFRCVSGPSDLHEKIEEFAKIFILPVSGIQFIMAGDGL
jgi:hypothetical protein